MQLPLLQRATEGDTAFCVLALAEVPEAPQTEDIGFVEALPVDSSSRIPVRSPGLGEQYRFHFNMGKCIGCKCCVVACNEQNGNPAEINWRRVGEVEGGWYPNTRRFHISMGCNHCVEPSCLIGCPVEAYTKDSATGIVQHSADACIGCQYCTWNCSYGVPQYNPERGVVGKCDMCHGRLAEGREPACVNACPEEAIKIEIVNIEEWKRDYASANAPGLPSADDSISTTRITLPRNLPPDTHKSDIYRIRTETPHWPLVVMTVLTQLSVGTFATLWLLQIFGTSTSLTTAALLALLVGGLALGASTLHLGRPIHAYRALKMWKRSWLSREVLLFTCFSAVAGVYAGLLTLNLPGSSTVGALTTLLGIAGVTASAWIYRVPARPAWNSRHTPIDFLLTGALLGLLFAGACGVISGRPLMIGSVVAASVQLLNQAAKFLWMTASESHELRATARLLSTKLASRFLTRAGLLVAGGALLPPLSQGRLLTIAAFALALVGEILSRYLFFVSVVPKNMASPYLAASQSAA
jgi:formate dehydrogenase iron-sulfur subunit